MLSQKAIVRLQEVKEHILAEPNNLIMTQWSIKKRSGGEIYDTLSGVCGCSLNDGVELNPPCGTAACIAGWICLLDPEWKRDENPTGTAAIAILGIEYEELMPELFLVRKWPARLRDKFTTQDLRQRAAAAAEAIDLFIAGGGQLNER